MTYEKTKRHFCTLKTVNVLWWDSLTPPLTAQKMNCCRLFTDGEELKNSSVFRRVQQFSSSFLYHQGQSRKAVAGLFTSGSESKNSFAAYTVLSVAPLLWDIAIYPAYYQPWLNQNPVQAAYI